MTTLQTVDSSLLSFIILLLIAIHSHRKTEARYIPNHLFSCLIFANLCLIVIDLLAWLFNALPGEGNLLLNSGFNLLLYMAEPLAPLLWVLYVHFLIFRDEAKLLRTANWQFLFFALNAALSLWSLHSGWFFSISDDNIYRRGDYFLVHIGYCYSLFVYSFWLILRHRSVIEQRYYYSLLLFFLPSLTGSLIQLFHYGVSYNWSGMMLSILIVYLTVQDQRLNTDYLTGVNNRRHLDRFLTAKIKNHQRTPFGALLIDLNKFKQINDQFGHITGDEALKEAVTLLRQSVPPAAFISRLGGDEFVIVLDTSSQQQLAEIAQRLHDRARQFTSLQEQSYALSFSIGYDLYPRGATMSASEFMRHIDALMYLNKQELSHYD